MASGSEELIRKQKERRQDDEHQLKVRAMLLQDARDRQKLQQEQQFQALSAQSRAAIDQMNAQAQTAKMQVDHELKSRQIAGKAQQAQAQARQRAEQMSQDQAGEPILSPPQAVDGTRADLDMMPGVGPREMAAPQGQASMGPPQQVGSTPSPYGPLAPYIDRQAVRQGTQMDRLGWHGVTETTTTRTPNVLTADGAVRERIAQAREDAAISKIEGTTLGDRLFLLKPNERQVEMKGALESLMQEYPPQTAIAIYQKAQSRITALEVEQRKAELTGDRAMERGERLRGISDANARARQALGFSESDAREARRQKEAAAEPENQMRDRKAKILLKVANGEKPTAEERAFLDELQRTSFEDKLMRSVTDQDAAPPSQQTPPPPNSTMRFNPATGEFEPVP